MTGTDRNDPARSTIVGLISDTHDLLRPEAVAALVGVDHIVHAGDVCNPEILTRLREIAPLSVVRGNCDHGSWTASLALNDTWEIGGTLVHAVHDLETLDIDPVAAEIAVVVSGHTHEPSQRLDAGVFYVNPGSAGPRRARLPVTLALLELNGGTPRLEFRTLL